MGVNKWILCHIKKTPILETQKHILVFCVRSYHICNIEIQSRNATSSNWRKCDSANQILEPFLIILKLLKKIWISTSTENGSHDIFWPLEYCKIICKLNKIYLKFQEMMTRKSKIENSKSKIENRKSKNENRKKVLRRSFFW